MFDDRPNRADEVVLTGRSNVGKSTLMRELTGHSFETGGKPGVTRSPNSYDWASDDFMITDLPGFGFMSGVPEEVREEIKTEVVQYIERHADDILVAILVVDGKSVIDIIDRHSGEGEIPHDVEMFHFLQELDIPTVVAVNKMDKVDDRDERLNDLCDRLGIYPPWKQWQETIAPITAKKGSIEPLNDAVRHHLEAQKRDDLKKFF
ncbi:GTP-binding protein EngB [Natranaeroarchaeum sulfidigenes]|uniref:Probable GTP-binding protein EngB n=1 Tax=Natranaeroarchaeum sulfidigenes TaxID=2784880 RepID=A0A897MR73_9EURY|nr:GTP-binding protein EngB [Natranaeroarchaeum sulfidigenes]QSG01479.1 GTP-binding protein EngB required for normal cell division in bacteria [Natranaeroarchaeum sulfidigenes]